LEIGQVCTGRAVREMVGQSATTFNGGSCMTKLHNFRSRSIFGCGRVRSLHALALHSLSLDHLHPPSSTPVLHVVFLPPFYSASNLLPKLCCSSFLHYDMATATNRLTEFRDSDKLSHVLTQSSSSATFTEYPSPLRFNSVTP
jgi:hypothetical protein